MNAIHAYIAWLISRGFNPVNSRGNRHDSVDTDRYVCPFVCPSSLGPSPSPSLDVRSLVLITSYIYFAFRRGLVARSLYDIPHALPLNLAYRIYLLRTPVYTVIP